MTPPLSLQTCAACKHAVVESLERGWGQEPSAPDYPLMCALSAYNEGERAFSDALAVVRSDDCADARLLVKATYGCPQHTPAEGPKLATYRHRHTTNEELKLHFRLLSSGAIRPQQMLAQFRPSGGEFACVEELRAAFEKRFATGAKCVPNPLRVPCTGWSDETGCPGHTIPIGIKPE